MNAEIMQMIKDGTLSSAERQDLYALAGHMANLSIDDELDNQDFVYMYMKGDRDWKQDFATIFGKQPGKAKRPTEEEFNTSKIHRAFVRKKKD